MERILGVDPYTICINCSALIVFDSSFPYPYAIGVVLAVRPSKARISFIDGFSRGDADRDRVPEFHDITLCIDAALRRGDEVRYRVYIVPLSHRWSLRLPIASIETLAKRLLALTLEDLVNGTGYLRALARIGMPIAIPREVTISKTILNTYEYTVAEIVTRTETLTLVRTRPFTITVTKHTVEKHIVTLYKQVITTKTIASTYTESITIVIHSYRTTTITITATHIPIDPVLANIVIGIIIGIAIVVLIAIAKKHIALKREPQSKPISRDRFS